MFNLIPYTQPGARDHCDQVVNEIHKTRYSIIGFSHIYNIVEDNFIEPQDRRLKILACLNEIKNVSKTDLQQFSIDVKV